MGKNDNMLTFEATFVRKTEKELVAKIDGQFVRLLLSKIEIEEDLEDIQSGNKIMIDIPEWIATDRQLI